MRWRDASDKDEAEEAEPQVSTDGSMIQSITRFWVTFVVVGLIVYGTLLTVGRQAGFRDLVSNRLDLLLGMPVKIERVSLDRSLRVTITGLQEATEGIPRVTAGEVVLQVRLLALLRGERWPVASLKVRDGLIRFTRDATGVWSPLPELAAGLLPWHPDGQGSAGGVGVTEWMRTSGTLFDLEQLTLIWYGEHAEAPEGLVQGLSLRAAKVKPFDDDVLWANLRIAYAEKGGMPWLKEFEMEWLRLPDRDAVLWSTLNLVP